MRRMGGGPVGSRSTGGNRRSSHLASRCGGAALCLLLATGGVALWSSAASATTSVTLYVSQSGGTTAGCTSSGSGACQTIAEGITAAEALSGDDVTIDVAASTTAYAEQLVIDDTVNPALTIDGAGASTTTLSGSGTGCDVTITDGTVTLNGLTITDGDSVNGGGVCNADTVTLTNDTLSHDTGSNGGALNNSGYAYVTDDVLTDDSAGDEGGAVYSVSDVDDALALFTDVTISHDTAGYEGGAIFSGGGSFSFTDCTVADDSADQGGAIANYAYALATGTTFTDDTAGTDGSTQGDGGAVYNQYHITLTGDTFDDDTATYEGGAVSGIVNLTATGDTFTGDSAVYGGAVYAMGVSTYSNDTFEGDHATTEGGGLFAASATVTDDTFAADVSPSGPGIYDESLLTLTGSILDGAGCGASVGVKITDGGYNDESDKTCGLGTTSKTGNSSIDLAKSLAANGSKGPETLALASGSSAIDEVPAAECTIATDERGDPRPGIPGQTSCDAGAYEFQATTPSAPRSAKAVAGTKEITVSWKAPSSDGGLAIKSYDVFCSTSKTVSSKGKPSAKTTGKATSAKVSGLKGGKKYYCIVVAVNAKGSSPPSATVEAAPRS